MSIALLTNRAYEVMADVESEERREEVRKLAEYPEKGNCWRRRARLLLQAAPRLDIDKVVEHREPLNPDDARLAPTQIRVKLRGGSTAELKATEGYCALCRQPLRGSAFVNITSGGPAARGLVSVDLTHEMDLLCDEMGATDPSLLLTGRVGRTVFSQNRPRAPKRYKLMMKQVVGGTFCGFLEPAAESLIVELLVEGCMAKDFSSNVHQVLNKVKALLTEPVEHMLQTISERLTDSKFNIRWSSASNNCRDFCDKLLDAPQFQCPFPTETNPAPFLMSFACRP